LLSGIASVLGASPEEIAAGAGMDETTASEIAQGRGAVGRFLRAVECHESDDVAGLAETGITPFDVSRAYLTGLGSALSTVDSVLGTEA
jgi:hypothetical protein